MGKKVIIETPEVIKRRYARWDRDEHRNEKLDALARPLWFEVANDRSGYWGVDTDYFDVPEGYRKFEISRDFLHRHHKVVFAMLRKWGRGESARDRYRREQYERGNHD